MQYFFSTFSFLWLGLFCFNYTNAQTTDLDDNNNFSDNHHLSSGDAFLITDINENYYLNPYLSILKDKKQQLDIEQVVDKSEQFQSIDFQQIDDSESAYWAKFTLESTLEETSNWVLMLGDADFVEVYVQINGGYKKFNQQKTGVLVPENERPITYHKNAVPLLLQGITTPYGSETSIYIRYLNTTYHLPKINVFLANPNHAKQQYLQHTSTRNWMQGLFHGVIWILIIYHLFIYWQVKQPVYLYYLAYLVGISLYMLNHYELLPLGNFPMVTHYVRIVATTLFLLTYVQFVRTILNTKESVPQWDRKLLFFLFAQGANFFVALAILWFWNNVPLHDMLWNMFILFSLVLLVVPIMRLTQLGNEIAYYIGWGSLALLFGAMGYVVLLQTGSNVINPSHLLQVGVIVKTIFYTWALGTMMRQEQEEKLNIQHHLNHQLRANIELQTQMNRDLEHKVRIRTAEISAQKTALQTQTNELQTANKQILAQNKIINQERDKSEKLLLNILPKRTAIELKATGKATPQSYGMVSILFTDFKDFTKIAASYPPEKIVADLDTCFKNFDDIILKHGLEKIKTIGDAYMCAGGIPVPNHTNPTDTIKAALDMLDFMQDFNQTKIDKGEPIWELRIGIHTGKVVAGVVGKQKFAYDIWGDAVNVAARMESNGEAGRINISGITYELVNHLFDCIYRGKVAIKNKGLMNMYFVNGKKIVQKIPKRKGTFKETNHLQLSKP